MRGADLIKTAAVAVALAAAAGSVQAAEPLGIWQVPGSVITIQVAPCGAALCGILINSNRIKADPNARDDKNKNPALRTRPLRGVAMLQGFQGGPPAWKGKVYVPGNGDTYGATLTLTDADTLNLKVCPAGPLCQTRTLKRVK